MRNSGKPKILVVRRDNIGDLVCTTPVFAALRERYPTAELCALVNSYNAAILEDNPYLDEVYVYTKAKHRPPGKSIVRVYWERAVLFLTLRHKRFDYAILASTPASVPRALKLARTVRPQHIIAYKTGTDHIDSFIDVPVVGFSSEGLHEAEIVFKLLSPLHIEGTPSPLQVFPKGHLVDQASALLRSDGKHRLIGIHISARKPSQRWPAERFIQLIRALSSTGYTSFALFWSPGDQSNPLHPGDDKKAHEIMAGLAGQPIKGFPTIHLEELIAGLSVCDAVICSDGGAMHIAAGLGKPILCFFGQSSAVRWRPWGVPYVLIQPPSQNVEDVPVEEVLSGFSRLMSQSEGELGGKPTQLA